MSGDTFGYWMKQDGTDVLVRTALLPPEDFDGWEFHEAPTGLLTISLAGSAATPAVGELIEIADGTGTIVRIVEPSPVPVPPGVEPARYDPETREWVVPGS